MSAGSLRLLKPIKALVVGDFVLDYYTMGSVGRISPEAPVPVLLATKKTFRPGMAGNVVLNLVSLGAHVLLAGRVGNDQSGKKFISALKDENVDTTCVISTKEYETPIKERFIASSQQLLRADFEKFQKLTLKQEKEIIKRIKAKQHEFDIIAVSDYQKGLLSDSFLKKLIEIAKSLSIPVVVDPKGEDFSKYFGATLIKPNLKEALIASKCSKEEDLSLVASKILERSGAEKLLITRSEEGMSLFCKNGSREDLPVKSKEVRDVTGAGDTVLAVITMALANGLSASDAATLANVAASITISKLGCVRVTLADIAEKLLHFHSSNKIFDEDYLFALKQLLSGKDFTVLGLEPSQTMSEELFSSIKRLSCDHADHLLILYVSHDEENESFVSLLSSIQEVDFIILKSHDLASLCDKLSPKEVFLIKENKLTKYEHPSHLLAELANVN